MSDSIVLYKSKNVKHIKFSIGESKCIIKFYIFRQISSCRHFWYCQEFFSISFSALLWRKCRRDLKPEWRGIYIYIYLHTSIHHIFIVSEGSSTQKPRNEKTMRIRDMSDWCPLGETLMRLKWCIGFFICLLISQSLSLHYLSLLSPIRLSTFSFNFLFQAWTSLFFLSLVDQVKGLVVWFWAVIWKREQGLIVTKWRMNGRKENSVNWSVFFLSFGSFGSRGFS